MAGEQRPQRRVGVLAQEVDGTVVLLDPDSGESFALEGIGSTVWQLCDGTKTVEEIAAAIHAEFDAPEATIQADVLDLLEELANQHLVLGDGAA